MLLTVNLVVSSFQLRPTQHLKKFSGNSTTVSGKKSTVDVQTSTKKFENMSGLMPKGRKDIKSKAKTSGSPSGAPTERINNLDQDSRHEDASDKQSSNKVLDGLSTSISGVGHGHGDKSSSSGHITGAQNIASSLHEMSLNVRTEPSNNSKVRKATSDSTFKSEKWMHPNEADNMSQLNLAIVGLLPDLFFQHGTLWFHLFY